MVTKEENDPVSFIGRFVLAQILTALAFALAHTGVALQAQTPPAQSKSIHAPSEPVDINTATVDQLLKVPGMTSTWAARIVRFRPYHAKNELLDRGILNSQAYDRIKDYIIARRPAQ